MEADTVRTTIRLNPEVHNRTMQHVRQQRFEMKKTNKDAKFQLSDYIEKLIIKDLNNTVR